MSQSSQTPTVETSSRVSANLSGPEAFVKLQDKIKSVRFCMLTTRQDDEILRSRPMTTLQADDSGVLWFFLRNDSPKVFELEQDSQVNLSYADTDKQLYVSVSGKAQLSQDRVQAKKLWNPALKAWFPDGLEDPQLSLLRVEVEQAEYWDAPSNKMVQLFGMVQAIVTGKAYDRGENAKLNLQSA